MAKLEERTLFQEWQAVEQDWYSIYQWKRTTGSDYTEWISEWIWTSISGINLITDGLRQRPFRWPEHRGQIRLGTDISQITEKRLLRAMFNLSEVPLLSKVIDYEVLSFPPFSNHGAQKISKTFWACYGSFFHGFLRR